jgi:uncharacterized protein with von Willebrand factor type A (vWA) domain
MTNHKDRIPKRISPNGNQTIEAFGTRLARRWIAFGRLLKRNGVHLSPAQMQDLLRVLPTLDAADRDAMYYASRALLCSRKEDLPRFDLTFRQFWGRTRQMIIPSDTGSLNTTNGISPDSPEHANTTRKQEIVPIIDRTTVTDSEGNISPEGSGDDNDDITQVLLYSAQERLRNVDFARFTEDELTAARLLLQTWDWEPGTRRTRRHKPAKRGPRLDFRRTVRRAMRTEGVAYRLMTLGPRQKPRPLVVLCDVSGSMAPYTRMLLYFLHTLHRGVNRSEVFLFGTRLSRITRQLKVRDVDTALSEVSRQVTDWSGGTRLGESLRTFNTKWARRVLGHGAVVCIISDGWDRGDPALMAAEMAHLQKMSFRLIWLNPLLGVKGYRPITRGMAAALNYIDNFLPAHNLASLEALAKLLSSLDNNTRPNRRQSPRMSAL